MVGAGKGKWQLPFCAVRSTALVCVVGCMYVGVCGFAATGLSGGFMA